MTSDDGLTSRSGGGGELPPAVRAFDKTAPAFDERFGAWRSVAAQRSAVRKRFKEIFPRGSRLLELAGGTGEDAIDLLRHGYNVTVTDGSPRMVELASAKVRAAGFGPERASFGHLVLEDIARWEAAHASHGGELFDGVYTNFAALNCLGDLRILAAPLARLVRARGSLGFVVFGPMSVGEIVVELARGRPRAAFRRFRRGAAPAKLGGERFEVWYPWPRAVAQSLEPYFQMRSTRGIGILVPPSAAEPWISRFPRAIEAMAAVDRLLSTPLALLGDHVLVHLERTTVHAP